MDWNTQIYLSTDEQTLEQLTLHQFKSKLEAGEIERKTLLYRNGTEGWLSLKEGLAAIHQEFTDFPEYPLLTRPRQPPPIPTTHQNVKHAPAPDLPDQNQAVAAPTPVQPVDEEQSGCLPSFFQAMGCAWKLLTVVCWIGVALIILGVILANSNPTAEQHFEAIVLDVVPHDLPFLPYVTEDWAAIYAVTLMPSFSYQDHLIYSESRITAPNGDVLVTGTGFLGKVEVSIETKTGVNAQLIGNPRR